jgi:hypothetical protein
MSTISKNTIKSSRWEYYMDSLRHMYWDRCKLKLESQQYRLDIRVKAKSAAASTISFCIVD